MSSLRCWLFGHVPVATDRTGQTVTSRLQRVVCLRCGKIWVNDSWEPYVGDEDE